MPIRICIVTTGQPSTNPRVVKEADALVEAGYDVMVICSHWAGWANKADVSLLASRRWLCSYIGGSPKKGRLLYTWTRLRHRLGQRIFSLKKSEMFYEWALSRVTPSLIRAAKKIRADVYIAHYPGALPAAVKAAKRWGAKAGFDAEDFHSGEISSFRKDSIITYFERKYIPQCFYVTASSPAIGKAYVEAYHISKPVTLLNVFSLRQAPYDLRDVSISEPLTLYWFSQTIGAKRGVEDVIGALGLLKDCQIELHLQGEWQEGYDTHLMKLASLQEVPQERIVHHPPSSQDEMIQIASDYDVGLALEPGKDLNNKIAISNKIFTYLLAGLAVVATRTPGHQLILDDLKGGFSYDPGDVASLANQLRCWYQNRQALQEARRASWDLGRHKYHWDLEKEKFLALIRGVLSKKVA